MASFFIGLLSVVLLLVSAFIVLIVMAQKTSSGMGGALGGGMAESALGAQAGQVMTRWTIYATVGFFVLCFGLYLLYMGAGEDPHSVDSGSALPQVEVLSEGQLTQEPAGDA